MKKIHFCDVADSSGSFIKGMLRSAWDYASGDYRMRSRSLATMSGGDIAHSVVCGLAWGLFGTSAAMLVQIGADSPTLGIAVGTGIAFNSLPLVTNQFKTLYAASRFDKAQNLLAAPPEHRQLPAPKFT